MEEIYIVKLKGLPPPSVPSQDSLSKESKTSFYYHTDLTAEAIRGFSYLHIFFGITVLCLSVTNLCFHDNPWSLEPPLGITVWCAVSFIILGFFGILTAYKRKCDLSGSIIYVKFQLALIMIVVSLTLTFAILFALDLHGPIANQFIGLNIIFSIIVESVILILTLFTCARVLWPGCLNFCAKDWPMQPSLKRKMIVKTKIFANGIQQDKANIIQSFGPNCVISLNMPPVIASDQTSSKNSSICSSAIYKNNINIKDKTSSLSGSTSDLAKSLSTIYASPDEQQQIDIKNNSCKDRMNSISTNSIYYNYPVIGMSSTNLLQTFPTSRQNREQFQLSNSSKITNDQQSSPIIYDSSTNNSDNSWYRGIDLYSASEQTDPYDTDEFEYCSTENEDEIEINNNIDINANNFHKTSSDDGNGTLENESISNSISASSLNKSESNNEEEEIFENINDSHETLNESIVDSNHKTSTIEYENKSKEINLEIDDKIEKKFYDQNKYEETEHFNINQIIFDSFHTMANENIQQNTSSNTIIKIESSINPESSVTAKQDVKNLKSSEKNQSSTTTTTTNTTTIRLLNTNKISSNHNKFNNNISMINNKNHSVAKIGNKLTSHPYLCKLRATNTSEKFEPYRKNNLIVSKPIPDIQRV